MRGPVSRIHETPPVTPHMRWHGDPPSSVGKQALSRAKSAPNFKICKGLGKTHQTPRINQYERWHDKETQHGRGLWSSQGVRFKKYKSKPTKSRIILSGDVPPYNKWHSKDAPPYSTFTDKAKKVSHIKNTKRTTLKCTGHGELCRKSATDVHTFYAGTSTE